MVIWSLETRMSVRPAHSKLADQLHIEKGLNSCPYGYFPNRILVFKIFPLAPSPAAYSMQSILNTLADIQLQI